MKRADKSSVDEKKFKEFISELSENETLDLNAMTFVRGGEGDGGAPIPPSPKPPK